MIEVIKVSTGEFEVFENGVKTKYSIYNGSAGMSGRGKNEYLIRTEVGDNYKSTYAGSLQKAKKMVNFWVESDRKVLEG